MYRPNTKLVLVLASSLALSGCSSFLGIHFGRTDKLRSIPDQPSAQVATLTDQGRRYLDEGNTGLAVEAFQRALASNEPLGPVLNGMGVAYARLGRMDAARNLFQQAMLVDPSDQRFAANLAHALQVPSSVAQPAGEAGATLQANAGSNANLAQSDDSLASGDKAAETPVDGRLVKVSSNEYRIRTVVPQPAPAGRMTNTVAAGFKPIIRMELRASSDEAAARPAPAGRRLAMNNPYAPRSVHEPAGFKPLVIMELPAARPTAGTAASAH
ncbi:MAG: tetratricopeptide repeat protein [Sphingomonadales bacterium]|nr:tetratricopeptide repeat protein [Sphingomonadales bacterium]MDE2568027.1 tetratricopeptide repeat protein [Sphingomonadales bacterium]